MVIAKKNTCECIAVDFDGTLYNRSTDEPYTDAAESLKWFRRWGYTIVIFSARASTSDSATWLRRWLANHHILFDEITNVKPPRLTWLIDDRGIHFSNNWQDITAAIQQETFPWKFPIQNQHSTTKK